jgi:hypothetical protein
MRLVGPMFRDVVSGQMVNYYVDRMGRNWMAEHKWSLFRVAPNHSYEIWSKP